MLYALSSLTQDDQLPVDLARVDGLLAHPARSLKALAADAVCNVDALKDLSARKGFRRNKLIRAPLTCAHTSPRTAGILEIRDKEFRDINNSIKRLIILKQLIKN